MKKHINTFVDFNNESIVPEITWKKIDYEKNTSNFVGFVG